MLTLSDTVLLAHDRPFCNTGLLTDDERTDSESTRLATIADSLIDNRVSVAVR